MIKNLLILMAIVFPAQAMAMQNSVVNNINVNKCQRMEENKSDECLVKLNMEKDTLLNMEFSNKIKEIDGFDINRWWMGTEEQKSTLLSDLKTNQQKWIEFRNGYCQVASAGAEGTKGYSSSMLGCLINMNNRRIEEIKMIHPDLSNE